MIFPCRTISNWGIYRKVPKVTDQRVSPPRSGPYRCLVVDPPWDQGKTGKRSARPNQGIDLDYPTMTWGEIAALPIGEWAADESFLWLWATNSRSRSGGVSKPRGAGYGVRQRSRTFRTVRTFSPVSHGGCCGMKNLHVLLMVSLLTCAGGVAIAQDYDAGLKAAQAGDFQTALKEWKPLADQGHAIAQVFLGLMCPSSEVLVPEAA